MQLLQLSIQLYFIMLSYNVIKYALILIINLFSGLFVVYEYNSHGHLYMFLLLFCPSYIIYFLIITNALFHVILLCHRIMLSYHILSPSLHHPFLPSHHPFLPSHHPFLPSHHPFLPSHHPFLPSHHPFITSSLFICSLISHTKLIYLTHRTPGCSRCAFRQMFNLSCRGWNVQTC